MSHGKVLLVELIILTILHGNWILKKKYDEHLSWILLIILTGFGFCHSNSFICNIGTYHLDGLKNEYGFEYLFRYFL